MNAKFFLIPASALAAYLLYNRYGFRSINIINDLPRKGPWNQRALNDIDDITIHHAASSRTATAYDFARHHIDNKGWPGIGYHFVIDRQGRVFQTNHLTDYSYHNGYDNKGAVGVCLVGNLEDYPPTPEQYRAMIKLCRSLKVQLNVKTATGHREYPGATTLCPGKYMDMAKVRSTLNLLPYGSTKIQSLMKSSSKQYNAETADN